MPPEPTVYTHYNELKGLLRQEGKKVYIGVNSQQQFVDTLLYDFDLQVGSHLPITWNQPFDGYTVMGIDSILVNGSYYKKYQVEKEGFENSYDSVLVEGIGHSGGLLEQFLFPWSHTSKLMCYAIDEVSMYQAPSVEEFEEENLCDFDLGIPEKNSLNALVFPNPGTDFIRIQLNGSEQLNSLIVVDLTGKRIMVPYTQLSMNAEVDVSALSPGIYLLTIQTKSGEETSIRIAIE